MAESIAERQEFRSLRFHRPGYEEVDMKGIEMAICLWELFQLSSSCKTPIPELQNKSYKKANDLPASRKAVGRNQYYCWISA